MNGKIYVKDHIRYETCKELLRFRPQEYLQDFRPATLDFAII